MSIGSVTRGATLSISGNAIALDVVGNSDDTLAGILAAGELDDKILTLTSSQSGMLTVGSEEIEIPASSATGDIGGVDVTGGESVTAESIIELANKAVSERLAANTEITEAFKDLGISTDVKTASLGKMSSLTTLLDGNSYGNVSIEDGQVTVTGASFSYGDNIIENISVVINITVN